MARDAGGRLRRPRRGGLGRSAGLRGASSCPISRVRGRRTSTQGQGEPLRANGPSRCVAHDPRRDGGCGLLPPRLPGDHARARRTYRRRAGHRRRGEERPLAPAPGRHLQCPRAQDRRRRGTRIRRRVAGRCRLGRLRRRGRSVLGRRVARGGHGAGRGPLEDLRGALPGLPLAILGDALGHVPPHRPHREFDRRVTESCRRFTNLRETWKLALYEVLPEPRPVVGLPLDAARQRLRRRGGGVG